MLNEMIDAGINQNEIVKAIGCSRWALALWMRHGQVPSPPMYAAIKKAHRRFAPKNIPKTSTAIRNLESLGVNLEKELNCTKGSLVNWRADRTAPQSRYRTKLVELYREKVG